MVKMRLIGRLGNQLFIYAFARQILEKNKNINSIELLIKEEKTSAGTTQLELDNYNIDPRIKIVKTQDRYYPRGGVRKIIYLLVRKYSLNKNSKQNYLIEKKADKILKHLRIFLCSDGYRNCDWLYSCNTNKEIFVRGYFQCERYFSEIREILLKEITPNKEISDLAKQFLEKIKTNENIVCISVRCGDFLKLDNFNVCTPKYFQDAVNLVYEKLEKPKFVLCSDDVNLARTYIKINDEDLILEPDGLKVYEKLLIMSKCKHFIISNSTFSWWAQYLSNAEDKIVIAPEKWWNDENMICDIYQDNWILLST